MNQRELIHLIKAALADFKRNKIRTLLTSLGIMIGVLSVVMLIALGIGLKNYLKNQFEDLGTNLLMIFPGSGFSAQGGFGQGLIGGAEFDEKDTRTLEKLGEVDSVIPIFMKSVIIETEDDRRSASLMGTSAEIFSAMNIKAESGQLFTRADVQKKSKEVVLGFSLAEKLFGNANQAVGRKVRISDQRFSIQGVAAKKGDSDVDNAVLMPYKSTYGTLNPNKTFFAIYLGVTNKDDIPGAKKAAEEALLKRYEEDDFSITEQSELLSMINQIFNILNGVLVAIGSISLVVGGIGIMNIMYATVTERIKEIGIRRAIGATERDILAQFLSEALLLSVFGGLLGLTLATIIVALVRPFFPVAINLLSVFITLVISSGIGIFFGVFPARRASKLPPIEAIRYE